MKRSAKLLSILVVILVSTVCFGQVSQDKANLYYQRLTGYEPRTGDFDDVDMSNEEALFESLFKKQNFYNNRLASFISKMTNEEADPFQDEDDFQAIMLLAIHQDIDFRTIFDHRIAVTTQAQDNRWIPASTTYYVLGNNFESLDELVSTHKLLVYSHESEFDLPSSYAMGLYEGVLTTQGFGRRFIKDGTNRAAIKAIYDVFLCSKIESYKDATLDPFYIGPDIDKAPSDNPYHFDNDCSGCHAPLDSQRGAFAYIDVDPNSDTVQHLRDFVASKYNRNPKTYGGFMTVSDEWENPLVTPAHQERFQWRGKTYGRGVLSFGRMIADSGQFQKCMTEKLAAEFCERTQESLKNIDEKAVVQKLADQFRKDNYVVKKLIKNIVRSPLCK